MDTVTHILTGAVMAFPAKRRLGRAGIAAPILGSFAPDVDLILEPLAPETYFQYHRVFTNSIVGMAVMPLLVAWLVWRMYGRPRFLPIWALTQLAYCTHVFMDLTNSYGCKLLWPFSDKWQSLDIVSIIDPFITGLLIVSIVLMALKVRQAPVVASCFVLLVAYWGGLMYLHARALDVFRSVEPQAVKVAATPARFDPSVWRMVAETPERFDMGSYDLRAGAWQERYTLPKQAVAPVCMKALDASSAKAFMDFARFPYMRCERDKDGWLVRVQDLRFSHSKGDSRFVETVRVGDDGSIEDRGFRF
jgi:inner membrane protein